MSQRHSLIFNFCFCLSKRIRSQRNENFQGMFYHYNKLLIALCSYLILFNVFYVQFSFLNSNNTNELACESVGIVLHFFLISSFGVMLSMSILRYLMIYYVFKDIRSFSVISIIGSTGFYISGLKMNSI